MSERLNLGIHELLRYMLPGFTFLFVLCLPWFIIGIYDTLFINLERFIAVFLFGGFVLGYMFYYPYYAVFRHLYSEKRRHSLKEINSALTKEGNWDRHDARSVHTIALYRTKDKEAIRALTFQLSVVHSVGMLIFSIVFGIVFSLIIPWLVAPVGNQKMLTLINNYELWMLLPQIILICILTAEYWDRLNTTIRMEDYIVMQSLEEVVNETKTTRQKFKTSKGRRQP